MSNQGDIEMNNENLEQYNINLLGRFVIEYLFGDKLDTKDEYLFLSSILDETESLQSELIAKINNLFEEQNYTRPDRVSIQVFRRNAGFRTTQNENDIGNYAMAFCLKDYQIIQYDQKEYFVSPEVTQFWTTPCFEFKPHSNKKGAKPSVRQNHTRVKFPNGRFTFKNHEYMSILLWIFWDESPTVTKIPRQTKGLEEKLKKLDKEMTVKKEEKLPVTETVLYDSGL
jgi:hypothetical protein